MNADIHTPLFVQSQSLSLRFQKFLKEFGFECDLLTLHVCWGFVVDFSCHKILLQSTHFHSKFHQRDLSVTPVMPYQHDRIAYVVTMIRFHEAETLVASLRRLISVAACMSDWLLMWPKAAYSVYYTQREVSARLWNSRAYSTGSTLLKVYINITLELRCRLQSWHKGNCTATAHQQFVVNCSMRTPLGERRHKLWLHPFVTFSRIEKEIRKFICIDYEND